MNDTPKVPWSVAPAHFADTQWGTGVVVGLFIVWVIVTVIHGALDPAPRFTKKHDD